VWQGLPRDASRAAAYGNSQPCFREESLRCRCLSGTWAPGVDLSTRFVACDSVPLLDLPDELFGTSLYLIDVVVG
jgi:hypothetical protein